MIKVIAFDLVGVLVKENDFKLSELENKIERLFGPNISDQEFLTTVKSNILNYSDQNILQIANNIINSIYECKIDLDTLKIFKSKYPNIKLVVATNHISLIQRFILNIFGGVFDNIYISANMHSIKPNEDFYNKILQSENIMSDELLFLDDSIRNIEGAISCGIQTINVTKETNIFKEIENTIEKQ